MKKVKLPKHLTYNGRSFNVHYTTEELLKRFKELQKLIAKQNSSIKSTLK